MNKIIFEALKNDSELISLLGSALTASGEKTELPAVFYSTPPTWEGLPAISFMEKACNDISFADDIPLTREIVFELCIYSKGVADDIFGRMNIIMNNLGFSLQSCDNLVEPSLFVKKCLYKIIKIL